MRRILVEAARRKKAGKHGGDWQRVDLELAASSGQQSASGQQAASFAAVLAAALAQQVPGQQEPSGH
jgi:hypothetical protein